MNELIYAVVGSGFVARYHLLAFEKMRARVKWIVDLNQENARPWCERLGAACAADIGEAFADPEVNVVVVATNTGSHYPIVRAALAAGKNVICEKTLGMNAAEAAELVGLARDRGLILYTSYMKRFLPAVVKAKELMAKIGRPTSAYFRANQFWGVPNGGPAPAGMQPKAGGSELRNSVGGGILFAGGSHVIDMICHFFGLPQSVMAMLHFPEEFDVESNASLLLRYPDTPVQMLTTMHPLSRIGAFRDGWDERFEINGVEGSLEIVSCEWKDHAVNAAFLRHYDEAARSVTEYRFEPCSPFEAAERAFHAWLAAGMQGEQPDDTGYVVDAVIQAALESDRSGREVKIAGI